MFESAEKYLAFNAAAVMALKAAKTALEDLASLSNWGDGFLQFHAENLEQLIATVQKIPPPGMEDLALQKALEGHELHSLEELFQWIEAEGGGDQSA